ncbi:TPA: hypothetical protein ACGF2T_000549 [Vibrio cholerae]
MSDWIDRSVMEQQAELERGIPVRAKQRCVAPSKRSMVSWFVRAVCALSHLAA